MLRSFSLLPVGRWRWLLAGLLVKSPAAFAQASPPGTNCSAALKSQRLRALWPAGRLTFYGTKQSEPFPGLLGFTGADYRRFFLPYASVQPATAHPGVYRVAGKTQVKSNVCAFTGTSTVLKARRYTAPNSEYPQLRKGELICHVELAEDRRQPGSGTISGTLTTYFYLDKQGQPRYNTLDAQADGWGNNPCVATWTSYATAQRKPCHWGNFRIAESGLLDVDAGEFSVSDQYLSHGWQTYMAALPGLDATPKTRQAQAEEKCS